MIAETHCRGCGFEFRTSAEQARSLEVDCPGCHLCFDCAWPDCPVCGSEEGMRLNRVQGKARPPGFGAVPWKRDA